MGNRQTKNGKILSLVLHFTSLGQTLQEKGLIETTFFIVIYPPSKMAAITKKKKEIDSNSHDLLVHNIYF